MRVLASPQSSRPESSAVAFAPSWIACIVAASVLLFCAPAANAALVLTNDTDGNGAVSFVALGSFTLTGSDYALGDPLAGSSYLTSYTDIAATNINVVFDWVSTNNDTDATDFDYGGYLIGDTATVLNDTSASSSFASGETFAVLAGQTYGWFVHSVDAQNGAGQLAVSNIVVTASAVGVPEPMSLAFFAAGCVFLWGVRRQTSARRLS